MHISNMRAQDTKVVEGLTLDFLYEFGVNAHLPVWNECSQQGAGHRLRIYGTYCRPGIFVSEYFRHFLEVIFVHLVAWPVRTLCRVA